MSIIKWSDNMDWATVGGWVYTKSPSANINASQYTMNVKLPPDAVYGTCIGAVWVLGRSYQILHDNFYIDSSNGRIHIDNIYTDSAGIKLESIIINSYNNIDHIANLTFTWGGTVWFRLTVATMAN